jgi:hypothetical protein
MVHVTGERASKLKGHVFEMVDLLLSELVERDALRDELRNYGDAALNRLVRTIGGITMVSEPERICFSRAPPRASVGRSEATVFTLASSG